MKFNTLSKVLSLFSMQRFNCLRSLYHSDILTNGKHFKRFLETSQGGINLKQGESLAKHAAAVDHGDVVEIGSYKVKSAIALAYGMRRSYNPNDKRLFCIDPHLPFTDILGAEFGIQDRSDFFKTMLQTGAHEYAALINLPSEQVATTWKRPIGMLFIDGDHRYHAVYEDFRRWIPHVLDGGIVALDDCEKPDLGPTRLVKELAAAGFKPIDKCEKITFFRKTPSLPQVPFSPRWRSILVVAEKNIYAGGLLRFERLQHAFQPLGIEISFAFEDLNGPFQPDNCDILQMDKAKERKWDATILPGAGFSNAFVSRLGDFKSDIFGTRVQCILNDLSREDRFLKTNQLFEPHSVIFNSRAWTPGSYTHFKGERFAVVEGAVNPVFFAPPAQYKQRVGGNFIIGMQSKYLKDLNLIGPRLPEHFVFYVIRMETPEDYALSAQLKALKDRGQLKFLGFIPESELPSFYHDCDCIMHLERFAGWANLVAEAMACGVPVVCSSAGTLAIAEDGVTARVVDPDNTDAICNALLEVSIDKSSSKDRAMAARTRVCYFNWNNYGKQFLKAAQDDGRLHYVLAPEFGLHGKWPIDSRLHDINLVLPFCKEANILDIGCAEGVISLRLLEEGAKLIHGFDIDPGRIQSARSLTINYTNAEFRTDNVANWVDFANRNQNLLLKTYDIVLFLDVYQHLPLKTRNNVLDQLLKISNNVFAIRTPDKLFKGEKLHERITRSGFVESGVGDLGVGGSAPIRLYRKTQSNYE